MYYLVVFHPTSVHYRTISRDVLGHWWPREVGIALPPAIQEESLVTSPKFRADIYDPKTLAAMDQAFAPAWQKLRANDPFHDCASDTELE